MLKKAIYISCVLLTGFFANGQIRPLNMHYLNTIENSKYYFNYAEQPPSDSFGDVRQLHSAIRPAFVTDMAKGFPHGKSGLVFGKVLAYELTDVRLVTRERQAWRLYPVGELSGGLELGQNTTGLYTLGIGPGLDYTSDKTYFSAKVLPYINQSPFVADSLQKNLNHDAGSNRSPGYNVFYRTEIIGAYQPNRFFLFSGGIGKNFFGDGYRSMLLSDNAGASPFAKIETSFGPVRYVNLYQLLSDNTVNPFDRTKDSYKFSATHYISWNVTRSFNIGIFESVVWRAKDSTIVRGFDPNYLNPIVFYRTAEYGAGSADNVLLGLNSSVKITDEHSVYFELLLDEFLLSQFLLDSGWWGNKYGIQLGYKSNRFLIDDLYFQVEFNTARPFTYSHKNSLEAYGNMNASLAHPLGANFYELLNIISYGKKARITNKIVWNSFGRDTSSISNGQNPFVSYKFRDGDLHHKTMDGLRTNVLNETIIFEWPVLKEIDLFINATYNYRMEWNQFRTDHAHFLSIGIRSRLWNNYTDF